VLLVLCYIGIFLCVYKVIRSFFDYYLNRQHCKEIRIGFPSGIINVGYSVDDDADGTSQETYLLSSDDPLVTIKPVTDIKYLQEIRVDGNKAEIDSYDDQKKDEIKTRRAMFDTFCITWSAYSNMLIAIVLNPLDDDIEVSIFSAFSKDPKSKMKVKRKTHVYTKSFTFNGDTSKEPGMPNFIILH
jgi:hypothetical protein